MVVNLHGAFHEGLSAAFRMFDFDVEEEDLIPVLGMPYVQGIRDVHRAGWPQQVLTGERLEDLSRACMKVVQRFIQFSPSLSTAYRAVETVRAWRGGGSVVGLVSSMDGSSLGRLQDRLGWNVLELFDTVVTAENGNTKAELLTALMVASGVGDGRSAVYVGCGEADWAASEQAGCGAFHLLDHGAFEPRGSAVPRECVVSGFGALRDRIGGGVAAPFGRH